MGFYRKKPVVIQAEQWFFGKEVDGVLGATPASEGGNGMSPMPAHGVIKTLEGIMTVSEGDWIITGVKGEKYPCKPDIFELTYETV